MSEQINLFDLENVNACKNQYEITQTCYENWKRSFIGGCSYETKIALAEIYEKEKAKLETECKCCFVAGQNFKEEFMFGRKVLINV